MPPLADLALRLRAIATRLPGHAALAWLGRYTAHPDPRVKIANSVAAIVVGNQPFYPLYLYLIFGTPGLVGAWTWLTMPFFAAVPALARRNADAGRSLMCITGLVNTLLTEKLIGTGLGRRVVCGSLRRARRRHLPRSGMAAGGAPRRNLHARRPGLAVADRAAGADA